MEEEIWAVKVVTLRLTFSRLSPFCPSSGRSYFLGLRTGNMLTLYKEILILTVLVHFLSVEGLEAIITPQNTGSLRPGKLFMQLLTEPDSLIRLFEGFNLSFQMLRHLGRTAPALLRLPFDKNFLSSSYDHVGLDHWRRPYYSRMPTMFSEEAPRYIKTAHNEYQHRTYRGKLLIPMQF
ncbi:uncharacterized protein NPIL_295681 [Nephila pilipes]|uniref:Uncharacterized protein n=1 Tax=Nephila pilipes TaxID=299642 RepID=A0A8X6UUZ4_NEPPI|nr:uncharacterized protein NPIL_295681 [Nephila pilipes]